LNVDLDKLPERAAEKAPENKALFKRLKKKKIKGLDKLTQTVHDEVFEEIDCLKCANCCKTTGPLFTVKDIDRIANHLGQSPSQFMDKYLRKDEEGDLVLKQTPCAFLDADNYCLIYKVRPAACADYPHTHRRKLYQISDLTVRNTYICPAAFNIVENIKRRLQEKF
jgi:Fe-S-cluster containining protein